MGNLKKLSQNVWRFLDFFRVCTLIALAELVTRVPVGPCVDEALQRYRKSLYLHNGVHNRETQVYVWLFWPSGAYPRVSVCLCTWLWRYRDFLYLCNASFTNGPTATRVTSSASAIGVHTLKNTNFSIHFDLVFWGFPREKNKNCKPIIPGNSRNIKTQKKKVKISIHFDLVFWALPIHFDLVFWGFPIHFDLVFWGFPIYFDLVFGDFPYILT